MTMRSLLSVTIAVLALGASAVASPASADWRRHRGGGWNPGAAAAVGLLGGVAVGAAIASSARAAPVYSSPAPVYVEPAPRRVYVTEAPAEECVTERRQVWLPGWGWEMRRRTVCE